MDFEQISRFVRINVVGTSGSGKSTFARELAEVLNLPCYEMDQLFWKSDWQESSDDELFRKVQDVTSRPRWVLDGNYTRTIISSPAYSHISFIRLNSRTGVTSFLESLRDVVEQSHAPEPAPGRFQVESRHRRPGDA